MAAFVTRRRAANCGAAYPSALSGARRRVRFVFTLMKPFAPPSARSLPNSPRPARPGAWLWFRSEGLKFPLQMHQGGEIRWVEASYTAIHQVLTNPVYAGAYVYGRTRHEIVLDATGGRKKRVRHLPRAEWQVLIPEHHPGFIDWQTYEANQERIARNTKPGPH